jgi:hypothetical protein
MIGFELKAIGSENFFSSEKVMKALSDAERRVQSKFGAYVRQRAKTSIRPAAIANRKEIAAAKKAFQAGKSKRNRVKKDYVPSQPGEPPRSRQGDLKKLILFGYDADEGNVVIGPILRGGQASQTPGRLERGGEFRGKRGKTIRVLKRPYMKPAFDAELQKMPSLWLDSMRG